MRICILIMGFHCCLKIYVCQVRDENSKIIIYFFSFLWKIKQRYCQITQAIPTKRKKITSNKIIANYHAKRAVVNRN